RKFDLRCSVMTPAGHDRLMARTLFLAQLIGRASSDFDLPRSKHHTNSFEQLLSLETTAMRDSLELFRDMYRYNRFARNIPKEFVRSLEKMRRQLELSARR